MSNRNRGSNAQSVHRTFVKKARETAYSSGITLDELANSSTINEDRLLSIFEGKASDITLRELAGISLALGVSVEQLLT